MRQYSRIITVILAMLAFTVTQSVHAADEVSVSKGGIALRGYDPVAYFTDGRPIEGNSAWTSVQDGVEYHFASESNRDMFDAAPEDYTPAYGGWCSYGVRVGKKFAANPNAWVIVDGTLYVQLDTGTQKIWLRGRDENIRIANLLWPDIRSIPVDMLGN